MPGRWLTGLFALLGLSCVIYANDSRGDALEKLLAELRQLREVQRQEAVQSRDEFRHLERLLKQKSLATVEHGKAVGDLDERVSKKKQAVDALVSINADLDKQALALRSALSDLLKALSENHKANPLLADDIIVKRIEGLLKEIDSASLSSITSQTIALFLDMGNRVTTCQVSQGIILIGGKDLHVQRLRIGTIAELWMTRDKARCGLGAPKNGSMSWQELPASELKPIIKAFAVASEDSPAEVLLVPLPAGGKQ